MSDLNNEDAVRKVDLTEQITQRLMSGFPLSPEDIADAERLGIDIDYIALEVGACYEGYDDEACFDQ